MGLVTVAPTSVAVTSPPGTPSRHIYPNGVFLHTVTERLRSGGLRNGRSGYHPGMPQPWTLDRLIRQQWSITNRSGYTARSVRFAASGALVVFGRRDWAIAIDRLDAGQGYPIFAMSAWGSTIYPPEIRVSWFSDQLPDHMRMATLHWPASAVSFPGAPLQGRPLT